MKLDMSKAVFCGLALIAAAMFLYVGLEAKHDLANDWPEVAPHLPEHP